MTEPITTKSQMYAALARGDFGNTIQQWFDSDDWWRDHSDENGSRLAGGVPQWWGVRSMTPGGPCRLNCPVAEVIDTAADFYRRGHRVNISLMVDKVATVAAWFEVWDSPTGLVVEGIEYPDTAGGWTWRNSMPDPARRRRWELTAARAVLRRHLNDNDREDLETLVAEYPDHVIEFSALDRCLGTVPHRRCVIWEVRNY